MSVHHSPPKISELPQESESVRETESKESSENTKGASGSVTVAEGGGFVQPLHGVGTSTPKATSTHVNVADEEDMYGSNDTIINVTNNSPIMDTTQTRSPTERTRASSMGDISSVIDRENLRLKAMSVRKRQRQDESGGEGENDTESKYEWMDKWDENNVKIENVDKDMKSNFKLLFERMDRENELRRKEFELFKEENRMHEELLRQENAKREKEWDERLSNMQKQIDEMRLNIERMRTEDAQGRTNERESLRMSENTQRQQGPTNRGNDLNVGLACMEKVKGIEMWMDRKEREEKANNFVISGWVKEGMINKREVQKLLLEKLGYTGAQEKIEEVREIKTKKGRLIWVRMYEWSDKDWIMKNKSKLKGASNEKIFIDNDRTRKQNEMQREINLTAQKLREEGRENIKVRFGRLEVNGVLYRWDAWKEKLIEAKNERGRNAGNT